MLTLSDVVIPTSDMSDDVSTITFRLPTVLREKIKEQAKIEERSEGAFIRFHLGKFLAMADEETEVSDGDEIQVAGGDS